MIWCQEEQEGSVEVKVSVDGCMVKKAQVCAGILEEVENDHGLENETIPFLGGKVGVARSESGAKMIFVCTDHTIGGIAAVGVRGNILEFNAVLSEGFLHFAGALFVEDVESGV